MYMFVDTTSGGGQGGGGASTATTIDRSSMSTTIQSPSTMTKTSFSSSSTKSIRSLQKSSSSSSLAATALAAVSGNNNYGDSTMEDDGWHTINVYYGDRSGLGANPDIDYSFAQVHQDDIVLDLIGPNGYFIDLAANDAKDLTNTLTLERHGWNGLCIEPNPG
jgi:hypothetical protein